MNQKEPAKHKIKSNKNVSKSSPVLIDGGDQKGSHPKICHTYPTMMKLGIVIPYLKKIKKIYKSRDTPLAFC